MKLKAGDVISCTIQDTSIPRGEVVEWGNNLYICQDCRKGISCPDKKGYRYSWYVGGGTERNLKANGITDIKVLSEIPMEAVKTDDLIYIPDVSASMRVILGRCDNVVFISDSETGFVTAYPIKNLKNKNYKILLIPPRKEEDKEVTEAIKLLKDKGKIKDGKILIE